MLITVSDWKIRRKAFRLILKVIQINFFSVTVQNKYFSPCYLQFILCTLLCSMSVIKTKNPFDVFSVAARWRVSWNICISQGLIMSCARCSKKDETEWFSRSKARNMGKNVFIFHKKKPSRKIIFNREGELIEK